MASNFNLNQNLKNISLAKRNNYDTNILNSYYSQLENNGYGDLAKQVKSASADDVDSVIANLGKTSGNLNSGDAITDYIANDMNPSDYYNRNYTDAYNEVTAGSKAARDIVEQTGTDFVRNSMGVYDSTPIAQNAVTGTIDYLLGTGLLDNSNGGKGQVSASTQNALNNAQKTYDAADKWNSYLYGNSKDIQSGIKNQVAQTNANYKDLYDYIKNDNYYDSDEAKSILSNYDYQGKVAADNATASSAASNSGNIDSYSAANANRQQLAYTNAGMNAVLNQKNSNVTNMLSTLQSLGVDTGNLYDRAIQLQGQDENYALGLYNAYNDQNNSAMSAAQADTAANASRNSALLNGVYDYYNTNHATDMAYNTAKIEAGASVLNNAIDRTAGNSSVSGAAEIALAEINTAKDMFNNTSNNLTQIQINNVTQNANVRIAELEKEGIISKAEAETLQAGIQASADKYVADRELEGVKYQSDNELAGTKYTADSNVKIAGAKNSTDNSATGTKSANKEDISAVVTQYMKNNNLDVNNAKDINKALDAVHEMFVNEGYGGTEFENNWGDEVRLFQSNAYLNPATGTYTNKTPSGKTQNEANWIADIDNLANSQAKKYGLDMNNEDDVKKAYDYANGALKTAYGYTTSQYSLYLTIAKDNAVKKATASGSGSPSIK